MELFLVGVLLLCLAVLNVPHTQLLGGQCQRLLPSILIQACLALLYGTGDKVGSDAMQQRLRGKFHWCHSVTLNQTLLNKCHLYGLLCINLIIFASRPLSVPLYTPPTKSVCPPLPRSSPANPTPRLDHRLASP